MHPVALEGDELLVQEGHFHDGVQALLHLGQDLLGESARLAAVQLHPGEVTLDVLGVDAVVLDHGFGDLNHVRGELLHLRQVDFCVIRLLLRGRVSY